MIWQPPSGAGHGPGMMGAPVEGGHHGAVWPPAPGAARHVGGLAQHRAPLDANPGQRCELVLLPRLAVAEGSVGYYQGYTPDELTATAAAPPPAAAASPADR